MLPEVVAVAKVTEQQPKDNSGGGGQREGMEIVAAHVDDGHLVLTLSVPSALVRDAQGHPLPKAAMLAAIRSHIGKECKPHDT